MTRTAVDNVTLALEPGKTYALLGPKRQRQDDADEDDRRSDEADFGNDRV